MPRSSARPAGASRVPAPPPMVTRCVCLDMPLAEIRRLAARDGLDAEGAMQRTGCGGPGGGCGLCAPYIRAAIEIGIDAVPVAGAAAMVRAAAEERNGPGAAAPGPSVQ